jgi:small neutral amino acid transporter SnatA (MarC family)
LPASLFFLYSNVFLFHSSANDVFLERSGPLTQQHKTYLRLIVFGLLAFFFIASAVHCHFDNFGTATTRVMVAGGSSSSSQATNVLSSCVGYSMGAIILSSLHEQEQTWNFL